MELMVKITTQTDYTTSQYEFLRDESNLTNSVAVVPLNPPRLFGLASKVVRLFAEHRRYHDLLVRCYLRPIVFQCCMRAKFLARDFLAKYPTVLRESTDGTVTLISEVENLPVRYLHLIKDVFIVEKNHCLLSAYALQCLSGRMNATVAACAVRPVLQRFTVSLTELGVDIQGIRSPLFLLLDPQERHTAKASTYRVLIRKCREYLRGSHLKNFEAAWVRTIQHWMAEELNQFCTLVGLSPFFFVNVDACQEMSVDCEEVQSLTGSVQALRLLEELMRLHSWASAICNVDLHLQKSGLCNHTASSADAALYLLMTTQFPASVVRLVSVACAHALSETLQQNKELCTGARKEIYVDDFLTRRDNLLKFIKIAFDVESAALLVRIHEGLLAQRIMKNWAFSRDTEKSIIEALPVYYDGLQLLESANSSDSLLGDFRMRLFCKMDQCSPLHDGSTDLDIRGLKMALHENGYAFRACLLNDAVWSKVAAVTSLAYEGLKLTPEMQYAVEEFTEYINNRSEGRAPQTARLRGATNGFQFWSVRPKAMTKRLIWYLGSGSVQLAVSGRSSGSSRGGSIFVNEPQAVVLCAFNQRESCDGAYKVATSSRKFSLSAQELCITTGLSLVQLTCVMQSLRHGSRGISLLQQVDEQGLTVDYNLTSTVCLEGGWRYVLNEPELDKLSAIGASFDNADVRHLEGVVERNIQRWKDGVVDARIIRILKKQCSANTTKSIRMSLSVMELHLLLNEHTTPGQRSVTCQEVLCRCEHLCNVSILAWTSPKIRPPTDHPLYDRHVAYFDDPVEVRSQAQHVFAPAPSPFPSKMVSTSHRRYIGLRDYLHLKSKSKLQDSCHLLRDGFADSTLSVPCVSSTADMDDRGSAWDGQEKIYEKFSCERKDSFDYAATESYDDTVDEGGAEDDDDFTVGFVDLRKAVEKEDVRNRQLSHQAASYTPADDAGTGGEASWYHSFTRLSKEEFTRSVVEWAALMPFCPENSGSPVIELATPQISLDSGSGVLDKDELNKVCVEICMKSFQTGLVIYSAALSAVSRLSALEAEDNRMDTTNGQTQYCPDAGNCRLLLWAAFLGLPDSLLEAVVKHFDQVTEITVSDSVRIISAQHLSQLKDNEFSAFWLQQRRISGLLLDTGGSDCQRTRHLEELLQRQDNQISLSDWIIHLCAAHNSSRHDGDVSLKRTFVRQSAPQTLRNTLNITSPRVRHKKHFSAAPYIQQQQQPQRTPSGSPPPIVAKSEQPQTRCVGQAKICTETLADDLMNLVLAKYPVLSVMPTQNGVSLDNSDTASAERLDCVMTALSAITSLMEAAVSSIVGQLKYDTSRLGREDVNTVASVADADEEKAVTGAEVEDAEASRMLLSNSTAEQSVADSYAYKLFVLEICGVIFHQGRTSSMRVNSGPSSFTSKLSLAYDSIRSATESAIEELGDKASDGSTDHTLASSHVWPKHVHSFQPLPAGHFDVVTSDPLVPVPLCIGQLFAASDTARTVTNTETLFAVHGVLEVLVDVHPKVILPHISSRFARTWTLLSKVIPALQNNHWSVDNTVLSLMESTESTLAVSFLSRLSEEGEGKLAQMFCYACGEIWGSEDMFRCQAAFQTVACQVTGTGQVPDLMACSLPLHCSHYACKSCWKARFCDTFADIDDNAVFPRYVVPSSVCCPCNRCQVRVPIDQAVVVFEEAELSRIIDRLVAFGQQQQQQLQHSHTSCPVERQRFSSLKAYDWNSKWYCVVCGDDEHYPVSCAKYQQLLRTTVMEKVQADAGSTYVPLQPDSLIFSSEELSNGLVRRPLLVPPVDKGLSLRQPKSGRPFRSLFDTASHPFPSNIASVPCRPPDLTSTTTASVNLPKYAAELNKQLSLAKATTEDVLRSLQSCYLEEDESTKYLPSSSSITPLTARIGCSKLLARVSWILFRVSIWLDEGSITLYGDKAREPGLLISSRDEEGCRTGWQLIMRVVSQLQLCAEGILQPTNSMICQLNKQLQTALHILVRNQADRVCSFRNRCLLQAQIDGQEETFWEVGSRKRQLSKEEFVQREQEIIHDAYDVLAGLDSMRCKMSLE
jgi:hypothetical protein